jgi:hypothetical protein
MPNYEYHCSVCGQDFTDTKSIESRDEVFCPGCLNYAGGNKGNGTISIFLSKLRVTRALDRQDGRMGEDIPMPAYGPNVTIRTRRQLTNLQKAAREKLLERTRGEHSTLVPTHDPKTGKIVMEKITVKSDGIDIGEPHTLERGEYPEHEHDN